MPTTNQFANKSAPHIQKPHFFRPTQTRYNPNTKSMKYLLFSIVCATALLAQTPDIPAAPPAAGALPAFGRQADPEPKPYEKVITKDAVTKKGVFTLHTIKSKYYYEIPASELGKDFLWVSQIAKTTLGAGYGGQAAGNHVVRWERHDKRVFLRSIEYEIVADPKQPVAKAVEAANNSTILMAFNIEAFGQNDAPVIEVTRLFTTEVPEFSARSRIRARGFDASRTFVESIKTFPTNIETEVTQTYTSPPDLLTAAPGIPRPVGGFGGAMRGSTATILMHYSMIKLPEIPMKPRLFDERVGYFSVRQTDFSSDAQKAKEQVFITRWRLEKKDPSAALSEPVKPITYWVDPATPAKYVKWIKKGIEDWQPAFEAAGFKNGIVAKEAPTAKEDPDWSPEDARYAVVRWLPSTIENAVGPHVSDPRTGEILDADIQFYHNVMNLAKTWYFTQVSPLDPRAQKFPLPDDLMGRLIEYVVAHEVGHTLGFQHNMKASATYPADKVRDAAWVKKMGHTPTLMDYSRFNYVAQPEDKIAVEDLIPGIGPYDKWATHWGYADIPNAKTPEDERPTLNAWSKEQDETPWFRFSTAGSYGSDPGENTEAVGDQDAIKSTAMGLKNLQRVMGFLPTVVAEPGESYTELTSLYERVLGQWTLELNHVTQIVGGMDSQERHYGQAGPRFTPVPKERQRAAVAFLGDNAFATPKAFISADLLRKMEPNGELFRIRSAQTRILGSLISSTRLQRLEEQEALDGAKAYAPDQFLADVRKTVFKELDSAAPQVDAYRRNLQRSYVELVGGRINSMFITDDSRPLFRGELKSLANQLTAAIPKASNRETKLHLEDLKDQIAKALDPKFQAPLGTSNFLFPVRGLDGMELCWPDYSITVERQP